MTKKLKVFGHEFQVTFDKLQVVGERRYVGYRDRSFWVKCAARDSIVDHPNVNPFFVGEKIYHTVQK